MRNTALFLTIGLAAQHAHATATQEDPRFESLLQSLLDRTEGDLSGDKPAGKKVIGAPPHEIYDEPAHAEVTRTGGDDHQPVSSEHREAPALHGTHPDSYPHTIVLPETMHEGHRMPHVEE